MPLRRQDTVGRLVTDKHEGLSVDDILQGWLDSPRMLRLAGLSVQLSMSNNVVLVGMKKPFVNYRSSGKCSFACSCER